MSGPPTIPTLDSPYVIAAGVLWRPVGPETYEARHAGAILRVARMHDGQWLGACDVPFGRFWHAWRSSRDAAMQWTVAQAEDTSRIDAQHYHRRGEDPEQRTGVPLAGRASEDRPAPTHEETP